MHTTSSVAAHNVLACLNTPAVRKASEEGKQIIIKKIQESITVKIILSEVKKQGL